MNIIQHVFPTLGFLSESYFDDYMSLHNAPSNTCSILSPCYGKSFISFILYRSGSTNNIRFWSPLIKLSDTFYYDKISLSSVFLFSRTYPSVYFNFSVQTINF